MKRSTYKSMASLLLLAVCVNSGMAQEKSATAASGAAAGKTAVAAPAAPVSVPPKQGVATGGVVVATPPADYSAGFQMFYKFGLPDVSKGKYVKLESYGSSRFDRDSMYELRLQGNAWLLTENKASNSTFVAGLCQMADVYDHKALQKEREAKRKAKEAAEKAKETPSKETPAKVRARFYYGMDDEEEDPRIGGTWKEADPKKDIQAILAYLKKIQEKGRGEDWSLKQGGYGKLFLMAIHFHKAGFKEEANQIVGALFDISQDRRKVITSALNTMADAQYNDACDTFFRTGDWAGYSKQVDQLLTRYSTGWKSAPAVKLLSQKLKDRIAKPQAAALDGDGITDEDKALAAELASMDKKALRQMMYFGGMHGGGELWVLIGGKPKKVAEELEGKEPVVSRIKKRGIKSVPLLLALVKDDFLMGVDSQWGGYSYSHYSDDDEMTEERIQSMYQQMRRPMMRRDIAVSLLSGLVIPEEGDDSRSYRYRSGGEEDSAELKEKVTQWYAENKDKTSVQLARDYFKKGDDGQKRNALNWLLKHGDETDAQQIEEYFLTSEDGYRDSYTVRQFVEYRGEKAKPFIEKYEAAMKKQMEEDKDGMFKNGSTKKMVEANLKELRDLLTVKKAEDILAEALAGKTKISRSSTALGRSLAKKTPAEIVSLLLDTAGKATNVQLTADLIGYAAYAPHYARYDNMQRGDEDEEDEVPAKDDEKKLDPKLHKEIWTKFLNDVRPLKGGYYGNNYTISTVAASSIETLYGERDPYSYYDGRGRSQGDAYKLGDRLLGIAKARALAYLEGKTKDEIPQYPNSENVTDEQRKKLVAKLAATGAGELPAVLKALSMDELLALADEAKDNEELSRKVAAHANVVSDVLLDTRGGAAFKDLESRKGKPIDRKTVETALELCKKAAGAGEGITVTVAREACLGGVKIRVSVVPEDELAMRGIRYYSRSSRESAKAFVSGQASVSETHGSAMWTLDEPAATNTPAVKLSKKENDLLADALDEINVYMDSRGEESREELWKAVDEFCAGKGNLWEGAWVSLTASPKPPEKKPGEKPEEDDEDEFDGIPMGIDF